MGRQKRESTTITKTFADRLNDLVEEKKSTGLSHNEICEQAGVGSGAMSDWLSDNKTANIDSLGKLAKYFNVSADWLLGVSNERELNGDIRKVCEYTKLNKNSVLALRELCEYQSDKIVLDFLLTYRNFWEGIISYISASAWENIPDGILGTYPPSREEIEEYKQKQKDTKVGIAQLIIERPSVHFITRPDPELLEHIEFAETIKELGKMFSEFKSKYGASNAYSEQMAHDYVDSCIKNRHE